MRGLIWVVLLFAAAVVAASTLGHNDGLVSIFWGGWRTDLSMNLFVLGLVGVCLTLVMAAHGLSRLLSLPRRAGQWRNQRKEEAAHAALREALSEFFNARYGRSRKSAHKALALQPGVPALANQHDFSVLGLLLAATGAHRMQDRRVRDELLEQAVWAARRGPQGRSADDAILLLGAEWALDDRDAERAQQALAALSPGAARRTQALRLKMQAARAAREPMQALHMARLLGNHQAFSPVVAQGLLHSLAGQALDDAHDMQQWHRLWNQFDASERRDPQVAARAALRALALGDAAEARQCLRPFWARLDRLERADRSAVALALSEATQGITADWLPSLESAAQAHAHEPAVLAAVGAAYASAGLYGKARRLLEQAAVSPALPARARRAAWRRLAELARQESDEVRAASCDRAAAELD